MASQARTLSANEVAADSQTARECETRARAERSVSDQRAWEVLSACVNKGNFTLLKTVLRSPWREMVLTRPDGATLLAAIVAARGGQVETDGQLIRDAGIPVFPLGGVKDEVARLPRPKAAIFRAKLTDKAPTRKGYPLELTEVSLVQQKRPGYYYESQYSTADLKARETGRIAWARPVGGNNSGWRVGEEVTVFGLVEEIANVSEHPDREAPTIRYLMRDARFWKSPRTAILDE